MTDLTHRLARATDVPAVKELWVRRGVGSLLLDIGANGADNVVIKVFKLL